MLVEGNLFENHWVDAQPGYAIVFTPRGEHGAAPWATVEDVTFRYNIIRNVAAGFNLLAHDDARRERDAAPRAHRRQPRLWRSTAPTWGGNGNFMQIGEGPSEMVVEHNTILQTNNLLTVYGGSREAPSAGERFVFRNNIAPHNANGVIGQRLAHRHGHHQRLLPGRCVRCATCSPAAAASRYPGDNLFPEIDNFTQEFVNYAGGDYRLKADSEFRRGATDGADLGVNFIELARTIGARAREWLGLDRAGDGAAIEADYDDEPTLHSPLQPSTSFLRGCL